MASDLDSLRKQYRDAKNRAEQAYQKMAAAQSEADEMIQQVRHLRSKLANQIETGQRVDPTALWIALRGEEIVRVAQVGRAEEWEALSKEVARLLADIMQHYGPQE